MAAVREYGSDPVTDDGEAEKRVNEGTLQSINTGLKTLHYFYNIRPQYRYLHPEAAEGLAIVTERFQKNLSKKRRIPQVKIAISSALRPVSYQKNLAKQNMNALLVSAHSYGTSFDIFFDEYFVAIPVPEASNRTSTALLEDLRLKTGFLLGASLRRQLRTVLMETLIELQDEGKLYAIHEQRQRCYHVTVLKKDGVR